VAVERVVGGMRNVSNFVPGTGYIELSCQIHFAIANAVGSISLPHVTHILEFSWHFISDVFTDDTYLEYPFDPHRMYVIRKYRVVIGSVALICSMGTTGTLVAKARGNTVHADTLIDENGHMHYFIQIPIIDAHVLDKMSCIFRATVYFQVLRVLTYDDAQDDALRQTDLLRQNGFFDGGFPFVDTDIRKLGNDAMLNEILFQKAYESSMDETYRMGVFNCVHPLTDKDIKIPIILHDGMHKFVSHDACVLWLHQLEYTRYYRNNFPDLLRRLAGVEVKFSRADLAVRDEERAHSTLVANHVVLPQPIIVRLKPQMLVNLGQFIMCYLNLKTDAAILADFSRERLDHVWDLRWDQKIENDVSVPKVQILIADQKFHLAVLAEQIHLIAINAIQRKEKSMTLRVESLSIAASQPGSEMAVVSCAIPRFRFVDAGENSAIKFERFRFLLHQQAPPVILAIKDVFFEISGELPDVRKW
jgi:hypothetical protein